METERWNSLRLPLLPAEDERLVDFFFKAFSRFEHAMKEVVKYRVPRNQDDRAVQANWDSLWNAIGDQLDARFSRSDLATHPPKVQILNDADELAWEERRTDLLTSVRRVRNNLFHGAKQRWDAVRDPKLISDSLDILEASLEFDEELRNAYR